MIAYLEKWEHDHLRKGDAKAMNAEFGMVAGAIRKIGEACNRRMNAKLGSKCGKCGKPINGMQLFSTIPMYDDNGSTINKFACSEKCDRELRDQAHNRAIQQQSAN